MKKKLLQMTFGLWMICSGPMIAQNAIELEFYNCSNSPTSLCVTDSGVRLTDNNQSNLGQSDPNSSSCSVHFSHQVELQSTCSSIFQYMIEVSYYDTSAYEEILSWTSAVTDNEDEATLTFDTEQSTNDVVSANGLPYTSGCFRYHRIRWTVMDVCGNTATCEKRFELYDCHAPIPISNQGPTILSFHSSYEIQVSLNEIAGDYLDDCGSTAQFLFSTQSNIYKNDTVFQFCEVPVGVLYFIPIWVADQGRDLNCNNTISWDERTKYQASAAVIFTGDGFQDCDTVDINISGNISTWDAGGRGIAKANVEGIDANQSYIDVTDKDGNYDLPYTDYAYPVTVTPTRNDGIKNGVSTLDLVKIQKHLLGIEPFTQPELFIAADANNSYAISAIDLIVLRKLILGIVDTLPSGKSWVFFPADYVFPDPLDPWDPADTITPGATFPHSIIVQENEGNGVDFIGIKLGDVNSSADPGFTSIKPRTTYPSLVWQTDDIHYSKGDLLEIQIRCSTNEMIAGFQFTLSDPNLEFLGIKAGAADIEVDDYALLPDHMTVSWFSVSTVSVKAGETLFTVVAKAKSNINLRNSLSLNSAITDAEVYNENGNVFTPKLEFRDSGQSDFTVYPNVPNPWKEETTITFYLPEASNINLNIYSTTGQIQYKLERNFDAGQNEIVLNKKEFAQRGLMVYTIQSNTEVKSGKMIVIE